MTRRLTVFGPGHPFRGGIARTTTALVQALADRGHEVCFLSARRQYPGWLYPGASDRDPEACPRLDCAEAILDPFAPVRWLGGRRRAVRTAAEAWIVPYWTWAWAPLWRFVLGATGRPPAVAVVHNPADHDAGAARRFAARRVLLGCQAFFTHARSLADLLEDAYPEVPVAHHPLPPFDGPAPADRRAARDRSGWPPDRRVALFLGLIRPYKGVDLLLEAAAGLDPGSDWLVVVAGEPWGSQGDELERLRDRLGVTDRVRLEYGWVPEERIPDRLAAADLVVLPYRSGSQSAVAPMALGHGVPVLTTAVGGVPEIVRDGVNGVVVPPLDVPALTRALERLDRPSLDRLAAGAERSAGELNWSGYAAALEDLLDRVL